MTKDIERHDLDLTLVLVPLLLILIGLICLYSASTALNQPVFKTPFGKQLIWFITGIFGFIIVFLIPIRVYSQGTTVFYGVSIVLLLLVLFIGSGSAKRWIDLGFFRFQPSEIAKISTVLILSKYLSDRNVSKLTLGRLLTIMLFIGIPFVLITREPDVGTGMVFLGIFTGVVFWAGIDFKTIGLLFALTAALISGFTWWSLFALLIIIIITMVVMKQKWWKITGLTMGCFCLGLLGPRLWSQLELYQQKRLLIFLGMRSDPHGSAYQVIQSKVAIGSGGLFGKGFLQGSQTQLRFLPEQHNDFIFSVLGEEFGFVGVMITLGLFFYLFHRMLKIAQSARNQYESYIVVGCASIFIFQVLVNIGMTVGLVPVTGLPLPFLSYGGSSLGVSMVMTGLIANIAAKRYRY
jgi:rod shape determining protein RodA